MSNYHDGLSGIDGDDDGRTRLIKGIKLQFSNDAQWLAGDEVIEADREFLVIEILKAEQKWLDDRPVETRILGATEKFSDLNELNAAEPRELWREKFGKEVGPWERTRVVYLVDPETWQIYTFLTGTVGGDQAVRELREAVGLARRVRGTGLYPRVCLGDIYMKTSYGGRQRPYFVIKGYESLGAEQVAVTAETPKLIEAPPQQAESIKQQKANGGKPPAQGPGAKAGGAKPPTPRKADPDFDAPSAKATT